MGTYKEHVLVDIDEIVDDSSVRRAHRERKKAIESSDVMFCGGCGTRLNSTQAQRKLYHDLGTLFVRSIREAGFSKERK